MLYRHSKTLPNQNDLYLKYLLVFIIKHTKCFRKLTDFVAELLETSSVIEDRSRDEGFKFTHESTARRTILLLARRGTLNSIVQLIDVMNRVDRCIQNL